MTYELARSLLDRLLRATTRFELWDIPQQADGTYILSLLDTETGLYFLVRDEGDYEWVMVLLSLSVSHP